MNCLLVGATGGLGSALARELASRGHTLCLVGRDLRDLVALAADLRARHGATVHCLEGDLAELDAPRLVDRALEELGDLQLVILAAGLGDDTDDGSLDDAALRRLVEVNLTGPMRIAHAAIPHLATRSACRLVAVGSVASVRGRSRNMVYGAAKSGLDSYFQSLRHRLDGTGCAVQFYRAGFMRTAMFGDRPSLVHVASPEAVARTIVRNLSRGSGVWYVPWWWCAIALALKWMPWAVFRRLKF